MMIKCVDVLTTYSAASSGLCEITLRDEKANVWGLFLVKNPELGFPGAILQVKA